MAALAAVLLFTAVAGLAATYVLYPIFVVALGALRARTRPAPAETGELPFVSFIVIAFDEAESIAAKIENTLALEWPADRFELIVASDASTDGTDAIVSGFRDPRVRLVRNPERGGKTATTRLAVEAARGDVLVMSDATGMYDRGAVRALVAALSGPWVGARLSPVPAMGRRAAARRSRAGRGHQRLGRDPRAAP
jgi:cellulose synthase/poly-beta-1,6-N-acetylglucosamine synthase-like glycosyltransferase